MNVLKTGDIAIVLSKKDKKLSRGEVVVVVGTQDAPIKKNNPYIFERFLVVCRAIFDETDKVIFEEEFHLVRGQALEIAPASVQEMFEGAGDKWMQ